MREHIAHPAHAVVVFPVPVEGYHHREALVEPDDFLHETHQLAGGEPVGVEAHTHVGEVPVKHPPDVHEIAPKGRLAPRERDVVEVREETRVARQDGVDLPDGQFLRQERGGVVGHLPDVAHHALGVAAIGQADAQLERLEHAQPVHGVVAGGAQRRLEAGCRVGLASQRVTHRVMSPPSGGFRSRVWSVIGPRTMGDTSFCWYYLACVSQAASRPATGGRFPAPVRQRTVTGGGGSGEPIASPQPGVRFWRPPRLHPRAGASLGMPESAA